LLCLRQDELVGAKRFFAFSCGYNGNPLTNKELHATFFRDGVDLYFDFSFFGLWR
jgi:hypothetical protein